jgi:hypothetical protein
VYATYGTCVVTGVRAPLEDSYIVGMVSMKLVSGSVHAGAIRGDVVFA